MEAAAATAASSSSDADRAQTIAGLMSLMEEVSWCCVASMRLVRACDAWVFPSRTPLWSLCCNSYHFAAHGFNISILIIDAFGGFWWCCTHQKETVLSEKTFLVDMLNIQLDQLHRQVDAATKALAQMKSAVDSCIGLKGNTGSYLDFIPRVCSR
jgi:hypothetical protein